MYDMIGGRAGCIGLAMNRKYRYYIDPLLPIDFYQPTKQSTTSSCCQCVCCDHDHDNDNDNSNDHGMVSGHTIMVMVSSH